MKTKKTKTAIRKTRGAVTRKDPNEQTIYLVRQHDVNETYWGIYASLEDACFDNPGTVDVYQATPKRIGKYKNVATLVGAAQNKKRIGKEMRQWQ